MPIEPQPCGAGAGDGGADVEQTLLCDTLADGTVVGTALAVYEYDSEGNPVGAPTFVDPATGLPYVAQGTLMPCPGETGCLEPIQFCFTQAVAGPVDHPGRIYDFELPINPGFDFTSLIIDGTESAAGITWAVTDPDGATFATAVQQFIQNRFTPLGGTVTVTNPNAGAPVCGTALPLQVHVECVRIDEPAPDVVEAVYNGGTDLVQNPAYLTTPPTNLDGPQFVYLRRQDNGGTLNCTSVANRGWETNDLGDANRDFEIWGTGPGGLQQLQDATPTPRGTPIQEITADQSGGPNPQPTIWQTFVVPAAGNFIATLVHGARDTGEVHTIRLSTGDTDDSGPGDIINDVTNPVQVTNANGGSPGPWTQFSQNVALGAGTYTFSLSTQNLPNSSNRGGLFTDMRVYVDAPNQRVTAATDDDTCVVTVDETSTTTTCEWWSPLCELGDITGWKNAETGEILDNGSFWGQTPSPECCLPAAGEGGGGTVSPGNLVHSYLVCGIVGGIPQTLTRVVYTDQAGGVIGGAFIGEDGGPVAPTEWAPGPCSSGFEDALICYTTAGDPTPRQGFRREAVSPTTGQVVVSFLGDNGVQVVPNAWTPGPCPQEVDQTLGPVCFNYIPPLPTSAQGFMTLDENDVPALYDLLGNLVPAGTYTIVECVEEARTAIVLCDLGNDGRPFVRSFIGSPVTGASGVMSAEDVDLDGNAYVPVGPVGRCPSGSSLVVGEICYSVPIGETPPFRSNLAGMAEAPDNTFTVTDFDGSGVDVTITTSGPSIPVAGGTQIQFNPNQDSLITVSFSQPVNLKAIQAGELDNTNQERWHGFTPPVTGVTGALVYNSPFAGAVSSSIPDGNPDGDIQFNATTSSLTFTAQSIPGGLGSWFQQLEFTLDLPGGFRRAAVVKCDGCGDDTVQYFDTETGLEVLAPTIVDCPAQPVTVTNPAEFADTEVLQLCDDGTPTPTPFLRRLTFDDTGALTGTVDTDLDGAPYVVTGDAVVCGGVEAAGRDEELLVLCDSAAPTPNRFLRRYNYDSTTGVLVSIVNTTLDGSTPFAPVGAVGVCTTAIASDFDFLSTVFCDQAGAGTAYIQRLTFNSATGAVTATTNTTLTGAPYVPVGAPGICSNCCPTVVGQGCTNTGSGFYTAIRSTTGTISLIDSVTGAAVLPANIIACPSDDTARTLTAQARLVGDADAAWTPGADVVGTLTSVTMTVLSGTATLTDQSGTVLAGLPAGFTATWSVADDNTLTGPASIDAIGGSTVIHWTQR